MSTARCDRMQPAASPLKSKGQQKLSEKIRSALLVEREPSGSERNTSQATCFCARNIPSSVPRKSPCGSIPQMRNVRNDSLARRQWVTYYVLTTTDCDRKKRKSRLSLTN